MGTPAKSPILMSAVAALFLASSVSGAGAASPDAIGLFTALRGTVNDTHPGQPRSTAVKVRDDVLFKDLIETQRESRTKALFQDDTLLTLGENSRVEITEYVYDPANNRRSTVVKLAQGKLRALVGRVFEGAGSKFEVHTPTAVAAARGTYFVVWIEDQKSAQGGTTGVANIADPGTVAFSSAGQTVLVGPQQYSMAEPGKPPTPAASFSPDKHPNVQAAILGTELADVVEEEPAKKAVEATEGAVPITPPYAVSTGADNPPGNGSPLPSVPITPPAVISGAASVISPGKVIIQVP